MGKALRWTGIVLAVLALAVVGLGALLESEWFKQRAAGMASAALNRQLTIAGPVAIDWSLRPTVTLSDLRLANADWAGPAPMASIERLQATFDLTELFRLRLPVRELVLIAPRVEFLRRADGSSNWQGLGDESDEGGGMPIQVDVDMLSVRDGKLVVRDQPRDTTLDLVVDTRPVAGETAERLRVHGEGVREGRPFELRAEGGPLLALSDPDHPYPITASFVAGDTHLRAEGELRRPLRLDGGRLRIAAEGPDPAELYPLFGAPVPHFPPYRVRALLSFGDGVYELRELRGTVGDSDVAGWLTLEMGKPPLLRADLRSERLDLDDVLPVVGGAPATGPGESASAAQRAQAEKREQEKQVLPQGKADRSKLAALNAQVRFQGKRVQAPRQLPLDQVSFEMALENGVLRFSPLDFGVGGGRVRSYLTLDTNRRPVHGELQAHAENLELKELLRGFDLPKGAFGKVRGRADLKFDGDSVKSGLGSADGQMLVYMTGGKIDALLQALAGLNAGKTVVLALVGSQRVDIECAYTRFVAKDGVARLEPSLVATEDSNFTAKGSIDLGKERFDLTLEGHPRDTSFLTASSPVTLKGAFADPDVSILSKELVGRGLAAAAIGAIAPPLAVLPFIQPGDARSAEATCGRLTEQAKAIESAPMG